MYKNLQMGITDKMNNETQHFKDILRFGECDGCEGMNAGMHMHICPYAEDIHGNSNEICNCCIECINICAQEI